MDFPTRDGPRQPPSGEQVELTLGDQRAVAVGVGAGLREYSVGGEPVLDGYGVDDMCDGGRGQLLLPWPNRIRDGTYSWRGRSRQLPLTEPEKRNAIHGLTRWTPWRVTRRDPAACAFSLDLPPQPGYPFQLHLEATYGLDQSGLRVSVTAVNTGSEPCPVGGGAHPYLTLGTPSVDEVHLKVPADRRLLTDDQQIPVGDEAVDGTEFDFRTAKPVGAMRLDTAYTGLHRDPDGRCRVTLSSEGRSVSLWMDARCTHLMVFTGDTLAPERRRRGLAIEPMTCPPNAFASGDGLARLEPGERFSFEWGISAAGPG